jgi:hypothetical protein
MKQMVSKSRNKELNTKKNKKILLFENFKNENDNNCKKN